MWEQYKKSFKVTQAVILVVAVGAAVLFGRSIGQAMTLFLFMQFTAVVGAVWASRLSAIGQQRATAPARAGTRS